MDDYKLMYFTDNDPDDLNLMQDISDSLGHKSHRFHSGVEMLAFLKNQPDKPHIIFLDIIMPDLDGFQILKKLRQMKKFRDVPVVIHSSHWNQESISKCYDLGANYYMRKAFTLNGLRASLEHVLQKNWTVRHSIEDFVYQY